MTWKTLSTAPRDGTVFMLASGDHIEFHARWGIHRNTGTARWVDGHGFGVSGTHWDHLPSPPKQEDLPQAWRNHDDGA